MDLVARHTRIGDIAVLQLSGEVDLATLPRLSDSLTRLTASGGTVAVDLDGVQLLDEAGLGLLLGAAGRARQAGDDLVVVCTSGSLRDRLSLTGFDRAVRVVARIADVG
jgi:anti-sigma B factor antagonist